MSRTTREMSDAHEKHLATVIDGRVCAGSGNQFNNQMDVRNEPYSSYPIAVDGKSTMGKSVAVTLDMLDKAYEQAHGLIPAIGLRWYDDETMRHTRDWIAIPTDEFREIIRDARAKRQSEID